MVIVSPINFKSVIANSPYIFTIGVAGDSGSGKTTFTQAIRLIFGSDLVSTITLDDYHRYDREERRRLKVTPLAPEANDLHRLEKDLSIMKKGGTIQKPVYNHHTGRFDPPVPYIPKKILILEGLHTFFTPALRENLDFSLFVDPDTDVKREWKIKRDIEVRGYRENEVIDELAEREVDYQKYIAPQRRYADAIIRVAYSLYGRSLGPERNVYRVTLFQSKLLRVVQDTDLSIDLLSLLSLSERDFLLEFRKQEFDNRDWGILSFDGELNHAVVRKLERNVEGQTGIRPIDIHADRPYVVAGEIAQLILSWHIINRRIFIEQK
ncbi:MAG: phosphoribulokinase [Methanomicrobiales archaeon]|nr:phosphoribulokinase [Methanomicrobiales archaeon]